MIYNYILSLGSNIEPRENYLILAADKLNSIGKILKKSSIYETEPWGHRNQSKFYNAILKYESILSPRKLLKALKKIEISLGRKKYFRWGPREIDIDIIFCQDYTLNEPDLIIPHPDFATRRFVLEPMLEVDKNYSLTGSNKSITDYLTACADQSSIHKLDLRW